VQKAALVETHSQQQHQPIKIPHQKASTSSFSGSFIPSDKQEGEQQFSGRDTVTRESCLPTSVDVNNLGKQLCCILHLLGPAVLMSSSHKLLVIRSPQSSMLSWDIGQRQWVSALAGKECHVAPGLHLLLFSLEEQRWLQGGENLILALCREHRAPARGELPFPLDCCDAINHLVSRRCWEVRRGAWTSCPSGLAFGLDFQSHLHMATALEKHSFVFLSSLSSFSIWSPLASPTSVILLLTCWLRCSGGRRRCSSSGGGVKDPRNVQTFLHGVIPWWPACHSMLKSPCCLRINIKAFSWLNPGRLWAQKQEGCSHTCCVLNSNVWFCCAYFTTFVLAKYILVIFLCVYSLDLLNYFYLFYLFLFFGLRQNLTM
jgi:hypothetical protein